MKHRIHSVLVGAMGLASAAFFAFSGASCSQPTIQCVVGHGPYFAKYQFVSGDEACLGLKGEDIGLSTYLAPNADKSLADYNARSIAIQSSKLGALAREREGAGYELGTDKPYAFGAYTTNPDANNICYTAGANGTAAIASADMNIEEFDTGEVDDMGNPVILPAEHHRQEWKNIKVYVTAAVPGTQLVGDMRYENVLAGCSAEYKFIALFPSVPCDKDVHADDDNNPDTDAANDDDDPSKPDTPIGVEPDPDACLAEADPSKGRVFGSGINPDFPVRCDPETLHCILSEDPLTGKP
ncbi:hypothetical protein [Polyangium mundeleinium]|uniref:Uncharacterized protein n=1 Tax=Polyangium mundeleinium TaxID=2995306 RepID=A0ABT5EZG5_9BACT|nr:hypothetical protein [Polyangium mundeleinium]MDC0746201.1 hypothetical protein [Polyangium mundeleinium]